MSAFNQKSNSEVIKEVLDRGVKLRNCIIQSISSYDENPLKISQENRNSNRNDKVKAYLKGDFMSKDDENLALETLRSLSSSDLCSVTERTYSGSSRNEICDCSTCREYQNLNLRNDHHYQEPNRLTTFKIQENAHLLKFADSLKVVVLSLKLNEAGCKKVYDEDHKRLNSNPTFFIEYQLPQSILKYKSSKKVPFNNVERFCSRQTQNSDITFRHSSIFDISNLENINLNDLILKFKISVRNFRQKLASIFGFAEIDFEVFQTCSNLNFKQIIPVTLNESVPIIVGFLKVSLSLGCGHLYFGKEFTDAVRASKENSIISLTKSVKKPSVKVLLPNKFSKTEIVEEITPKSILFGFICIAEAQFSREVVNSYVTCQNFTKDDVSTSKLVAVIGPNPIYNFSQQIPLIYDDNFILNLRENYLLVEFFEKANTPKDFPLGLVRLPLHSFYLAYRNRLISKYLSEKDLPVIAIDGWEIIQKSINEDSNTGRALILLALGTKEQIDKLETQRGFKSKLVKAPLGGRRNALKSDKGVQSEMDPNNKQPQNIESLLSLLAAANKPPSVENSTNTEKEEVEEGKSPDLKKTTDLLESLQKALTASSYEKNGVSGSKSTSFRAEIAINEAMNLPNRKKCKSKKSKNKGGKNEDTLPSTYVTFEPTQGEIRITPVVPKSVTPKWAFICEVLIPHEYLINEQKRLVFKVWRKSVNTTMTPNLQTDVVIGVAALDLTVLTKGLPHVNGWVDIADFSNKCNGQINIRVTPLENVSKIRPESPKPVAPPSPEDLSDLIDGPSELGRALKRKFSELDGITQRLRLRLSKVTKEDESDNDEVADEFERDINTLCVEDDFDTVDFEKEALHFTLSRMKQTGLLQAQSESNEGEKMVNNKQQIDTLLERLNLISGENSRNSLLLDTEAILSDLDHNSRPNIHSATTFEKSMGEKFPTWKGNEED